MKYKRLNNIEEVWVADSGGAYNGGMFGAGVNEALWKQGIRPTSMSGVSAGAVNTFCQTANEEGVAKNAWESVCRRTPEKIVHGNPLKKDFWDNLKQNHTIFDFQDNFFNCVDQYVPVDKFVNSPTHSRIISAQAQGPGISEQDYSDKTERFVHNLLISSCLLPDFLTTLREKYINCLVNFVSLLEKKMDKIYKYSEVILDNQSLSSNISGNINDLHEYFRTMIKASCLIPLLCGHPIKHDGRLLVDGGFSTEMGGAKILLEEMIGKINTALIIIFKYSDDHYEAMKCKQTVKEICQKNNIPFGNILFANPETPLPISARIAPPDRFEEYRECYRVGENIGRQIAGVLN